MFSSLLYFLVFSKFSTACMYYFYNQKPVSRKVKESSSLILLLGEKLMFVLETKFYEILFFFSANSGRWGKDLLLFFFPFSFI